MKIIYGSSIYADVVIVSMCNKLYPGVPVYPKEEYLALPTPPDDIIVHTREAVEYAQVWAPDSAKLIPVEQLVAEAQK